METYPITSNAVLTLNLWVAGDVLAQYSEHKLMAQHHHHDSSSSSLVVKTNKEEKDAFIVDTSRTLKLASYGGFVIGPFLAVWYPWLERLSKQYKMAKSYGVWGPPVFKVAMDELVCEPPLLLVFFGYMNVCEGGSWETYEKKLKSEFWTSWAVSLAAWPAVLLGTFRFVPVYLQAPLINACCVVWDGFLSHRNYVSRLEESKKEQAAAALLAQEQKQQPTPVLALATRPTKVATSPRTD